MINVDRSIVQAPTLETHYRTEESMVALGEVFLNKCYICERDAASPANFEIDHFKTSADDPSLRLEWSNLYLICSDCNKSRLKRTPTGGFLDPCDDEDDVELEIVYQLPPYEHDCPSFYAAELEPRIKVVNSLEQLNRMHYGTKRTKMKCASLRETISRQCKRLLSLMLKERRAFEESDQAALAESGTEIDRMLSINAPFTMLMRSVAAQYRMKSI